MPAPDPSGPPVLDLRGVTVRFGGTVALDAVDLTVRPGEVVGLIGPNGAGKTTLFNVACGLVRPTTGDVTVLGHRGPLRPHRLTATGVARTLQGLGLFPGLTARQNVMTGLSHEAPGVVASTLGLRSAARWTHEAAARAELALHRVGVADHAEQLAGSLPYPLRKRVALARALVSAPRLLMLDEPAGGLGRADIGELADLVRELSCSVLLVEHHVDFVMSVCERVAVLDFGRLIADGAPDAVRHHPAVVEAYLGLETTATAGRERP